MKHFQFIGRRLVPILMTAAVLCASLSGCAQKDTTVPADTNAAVPTVGEMSAERRLCISAVAENVGFTTISADQLGGNFDEDIVYLNLIDVNITVDGTSYPLENAIRDGLITVEEIFAYARIDARNGICTETHTTHNGLTLFTYTYPEFDLCLTYDVYETPDGKQHLINDLGIYEVGSTVFTIYEDEKTGKRIDFENWGLTFDVIESNADGITLQCTQSDGQHIGNLGIYSYVIYRTGEKYSIPNLNGELSGITTKPEIMIPNESTSTIILDWKNGLGSLSAGNYSLRLQIRDYYDETQVHPLMNNFYDLQEFMIEFTIS